MTKSRKKPARSSMQEVVIDREKLVGLVAPMKVWELAQLAGISVETIVSEVVIWAGVPVFPGMKGARLAARKHVARHTTVNAPDGDVLAVSIPDEPEPELHRLLGRATRKEIREVVDRWVLGRVLAGCEWNISEAAKRLEVSRKTLRERWAVVRPPRLGARLAELMNAEAPANEPAGPSLAEMVEQGAPRREIHRVVDRWFFDRTLAGEGGNVSQTARSTRASRRLVRKIRDSDDGPCEGANEQSRAEEASS